MSVHLIGSSGFIGQAIQRCCVNNDIRVWSHRLNPSMSTRFFDLLHPDSWTDLLSQKPQTVILLSWPGLPFYNDSFHLTRNLPLSIQLIDQLIQSGCRSIVIAGTCYEYGLQEGALKESQCVQPLNAYAIAKDALRRYVEIKCAHAGVNWTWLRIFYPYGEGQNKNSLYPSLLRAIRQGDLKFSMSSGQQIRDFIPVDTVARLICQFASLSTTSGIVNIGSGQPVLLRDFALGIVRQSSSEIKLGFGDYPDRQDEPRAFWADTTKLKNLFGN